MKNQNYINSNICFIYYATISKLRKKAKIRNRCNQVPHLTQDTTLESDKNTKKTSHTREPRGQPFYDKFYVDYKSNVLFYFVGVLLHKADDREEILLKNSVMH